MSHIMPKAVALALACALTLPLAACGGDKTNQPSPDTTPVAAATPEPTPTPTPSAALPNEGPKLPLRLLPALLAALLLALALPLRRFWARRRRERRFQDENPNRAAIAAYLYLQRLTRWGAEPPARAGELAQETP